MCISWHTVVLPDLLLNKIIQSLVPCERLANTVLLSSRRTLTRELLCHIVLILTALEGSIRQKMLTENGPSQITVFHVDGHDCCRNCVENSAPADFPPCFSLVFCLFCCVKAWQVLRDNGWNILKGRASIWSPLLLHLWIHKSMSAGRRWSLAKVWWGLWGANTASTDLKCSKATPSVSKVLFVR